MLSLQLKATKTDTQAPLSGVLHGNIRYIPFTRTASLVWRQRVESYIVSDSIMLYCFVR